MMCQCSFRVIVLAADFSSCVTTSNKQLVNHIASQHHTNEWEQTSLSGGPSAARHLPGSSRSCCILAPGVWSRLALRLCSFCSQMLTAHHAVMATLNGCLHASNNRWLDIGEKQHCAGKYVSLKSMLHMIVCSITHTIRGGPSAIYCGRHPRS